MKQSKLLNLKEKGRTIRLLYVEDNNEAREQTQKLLSNFFDEIVTAQDGEEGLQKFQERPFDLILTDINMPRMNGLKMLEHIRKIDQDVTCIIISAHDETDYFTKSIQLGIDGYLLKPIDMQPFLALLQKSVEKIVLQKKREAYQIELEKRVTERTRALELRLFTDTLTGIRSRHALLQQLSSHTEKSHTILLLNIDDFTIYNELYGFEVGNEILIALAQKIDRFANAYGFTCYRVSGDEFVLHRQSDPQKQCQCDSVLNSLLQLLEDRSLYIASIDEYIAISATIGSACSVDNPLGKADIAMKHAKKSGKKHLQYNKEYDNRVNLQKTLYWRREIQNALKEERVVPYFQPIVDRNMQVTKYEALMRIKQYDDDNRIKIVSPFEFLDIAVKTRLYDDLSYRMIERSIELMKNRDVSLSLNINMNDINNPELIGMLQRNIEAFNKAYSDGETRHIILEILENDNIEHYQQVNRRLAEFKNLAVKIAIDDFGSGYSNFSHIIGISPHYLKIDGSLIKNIDTDKKSYEMVKAIVQFAKTLNIKTIAEFVSSKEIFEITYALGVDEFQGYYFGQPMSIEEVEAFEKEKLRETVDTAL